MPLYQILFLVLTYVIAAIPFGLLLTKTFVKKDVREFGSGNIGATNVARVAGKKIAFATLILDGMKGAIMIIAARFIFADADNLHLFLVVVAGVAVMAHIFPIYLKFKGGKGVATAIAVLLALDLSIGFVAIGTWVLLFALFRTSSISSLSAIFSAILFSLYYEAPQSQIIFCCFLFALITIRHKENLILLFSGKEKKFKK